MDSALVTIWRICSSICGKWLQAILLEMVAVPERHYEPDIRSHDLRHAHATLLLAASVHPKVVQERLGHSQISLTLDTYSHVIPSLQSEAADRFESILG